MSGLGWTAAAAERGEGSPEVSRWWVTWWCRLGFLSGGSCAAAARLSHGNVGEFGGGRTGVENKLANLLELKEA